MVALTPTQQKFLDFIAWTVITKRLPPTYREMGERFGCSLNNTWEILGRLERKGLIHREARKSTTVALTPLGRSLAKPKPGFIYINPGLCPCGATYFGARCPACAGVFQEAKAS